jgi:hypothetical protein
MYKWIVETNSISSSVEQLSSSLDAHQVQQVAQPNTPLMAATSVYMYHFVDFLTDNNRMPRRFYVDPERRHLRLELAHLRKYPMYTTSATSRPHNC